MRHLTAILAAVMLIIATAGWAFAGKIELMENEMDEITAAGPSFLDVILLKNLGIRSIGFTNNGQNGQIGITVNGIPQKVVTKPTITNHGFNAVELLTKTTSVGSQPGFPGGKGLIQTSNSFFVGFVGYNYR